jgi:hypothetical protein
LRKIVVEITSNPKTRKAVFIHNSCHLTGAVNPHFVARLIWRGNQNFHPDLGSGWGESLASDESPIERNIACEATLRLLTTVVPVENNWKAQLVAHSGSAL